MKIKAINTVVDLDLSLLPEDLAQSIAREWESCADLVSFSPVEASGKEVTLTAPHYGSAASYTIHRQVTETAIGASSGKLVLIHAGAIANDEGIVLGLVAPSGTGKTTATKYLGQRYHYVTDETLAATPAGDVLPYPKPLSIGNRHAGDQKYGLSPRAANLKPLPQRGGAPLPLRLGGIVLLNRDERFRDHPHLVPLAPLDGVIRVLAQTSAALLLPHPLTTYTQLCTRSGGPWILNYAEITDCGPIFEDLFARLQTVSPATTWECLGPGPRTSLTLADLPSLALDQNSEPPAPTTPADLKQTYQRCPWVDALAGEDGQILVSTPARSLLLSELSAYLWSCLETPRSGNDLTERARAHFGDHPQAAQRISWVLAELTESGILEPLRAVTN